MVRSLAQLPPEILRLIVAKLTFENRSLIVPFAQTYNRAIYAACSEVLEYLRSIPASKRAICDAFPREEYRAGWSRVNGHITLDLSYLELNGTLDWLDALAYEFHGYKLADRDTTPSMMTGQRFPTSHGGFDDLILQTEALGIQLPYAFIKFCQGYHYYQALLNIPDCAYGPRLSAYLHKVHPREGVTGYILDFWWERHWGSMLSLYLSPDPTKSHAMVKTHKGNHDHWHKPDNKAYRTTDLSIKDANGKIHKGCHHPEGSGITFFCFDFETWLAGAMCYYACCLDDTIEWERYHPHGSLRRTNFLQCAAKNPELLDHSWFEEVDEGVRESLSETKAPTTT